MRRRRSRYVDIAGAGRASSVAGAKVDRGQGRPRSTIAAERRYYGMPERALVLSNVVNISEYTNEAVKVIDYTVPDRQAVILKRVACEFGRPAMYGELSLSWRMTVNGAQVIAFGMATGSSYLKRQYIPVGTLQAPVDTYEMIVQSGETIALEVIRPSTWNFFVNVVGYVEGRRVDIDALGRGIVA